MANSPEPSLALRALMGTVPSSPQTKMLRPVARQICHAASPHFVARKGAQRRSYAVVRDNSGYRDGNVFKKEDTAQYDWMKLRHDVFEREKVSEKREKPKPKRVSYMPEVTKDELVVPKCVI